MKLALQYRILGLLLLLPFAISANCIDNTIIDGKYKKEKVIKKSFNVNSDATLKIDNSYGNLDIVTWDKNEIDFEITIITTGNDEEKVQKKLDEINVEFSNSPDFVSAITKFSKNKNKSWWSSWTSGSNNVNMKINYIVKMPMSNNVNLDNDYGNINLAKLNGHAEINCDYGKITTKELMADNNILNFDYSSNCYFEYIKSGKINADYSGYTVSKTNTLDINADYTKSVVELAENITYNCDYGGLTVSNVNDIKGSGDYITLRLGDVYQNVSINADYGSIKIDRLNKNVKNVNIDSEYVGIKIGYAVDYAFDFNISLEYGSLKTEDSFEFIKKRIESYNKYYTGYNNTQNSGNMLRIDSEYGSVSFYKN